MQMTWEASASLAVGNTVVIKLTSYTPLSSLRLSELTNEAGIPKGVINIVTGPGSTVGTEKLTIPLIKRFTFVGETVIGQTVIENGT